MYEPVVTSVSIQVLTSRLMRSNTPLLKHDALFGHLTAEPVTLYGHFIGHFARHLSHQGAHKCGHLLFLSNVP